MHLLTPDSQALFMIFLSTLLISILVTITLVPLFGRLAVKVHALDMPDERKVHQIPIPRTGGIAMVIGAFLPLLYWNSGELLVRAWLAGAGVLAIFGILDDFRGLGYKAKLAGQVLAALIVIFYGGVKVQSLGMLLPDGYLLPGWLAVPLTLFAIVGVTNAINLADGLDGLAGGICLLIFVLHRVSCLPGRRCGHRPHCPRHRRGHLRVPQIQYVPGIGVHGGHGEPVPRVFGRDPLHRADPGGYGAEPRAPPDPAGFPGARHPDRHAARACPRGAPRSWRTRTISTTTS